jgi:electron transfer flavoprotein alpha subunit
MGNILVVTEIQKGKIREASFELLSLAHDVAGQTSRGVKSLVIGSGVGDLASDFAGKGGGETFVVDDAAAANYSVDVWNKSVRAAVEAADADVVLFSNTPSGWDVAPRVAAGLDAGFVGDCMTIEVEGGELKPVRRVFSGKLDTRLNVSADRVVATVQPGAVKPYEGSADGKATELSVDLSGVRAKFVEIKEAASGGVDLSKASIIVSGGRGVGAPEKFQEVIKPLADALGGAMGASRPVVDAGWLPHEYQVGSSGQVVSPKLYIAAGISGAIQHLVGMKTSNFIIAINKDPDAPIFEVADVGAVGDLFEIVPALTAAVKAAKG